MLRLLKSLMGQCDQVVSGDAFYCAEERRMNVMIVDVRWLNMPRGLILVKRSSRAYLSLIQKLGGVCSTSPDRS